MMSSRTIDLDGAVQLEEHGSAGPTVVLVHGLGSSLLNWRPVAPLLARDFRVIAPDLRGHGRSAMPRDAGLDENLALLAALIEREVGHSVTLVGSSMGGLLSLLLAAARPDLVERLVLVSPAMPVAYARRVDPLVAAIFAIYLTPGLGEVYMRRVQHRVSPERAVGDMLRLCGVRPERLSSGVFAELVDQARERRRAMPWRDAAFLSAARSTVRRIASRGAFEHQLARVRAPTLLLHGDRDRLVPVESARAVARLRPDWTYDELPGIGHIPMMQDPEAFAARVARFAHARS